MFKPIDVLYIEYQNNKFADLDLSDQNQDDPDIQKLTNYVNDIKANIIKLDDIPEEYRLKLADLISQKN